MNDKTKNGSVEKRGRNSKSKKKNYKVGCDCFQQKINKKNLTNKLQSFPETEKVLDITKAIEKEINEAKVYPNTVEYDENGKVILRKSSNGKVLWDIEKIKAKNDEEITK